MKYYPLAPTLRALILTALSMPLWARAEGSFRETRGIAPVEDLLRGTPLGMPQERVKDETFSTATRFVVDKAGENPWARQVSARLPGTIAKGDTVFALVYLRTLSAETKTAEASVRILLEQTGTWKSILDKTVTVGREWTRFAFAVKSSVDLAGSTVNFSVQGGHIVQSLDIAGAQVLKFAPSVPPESLTALDPDVTVPLRSVANMGYSDPVAGDGKGGWSDQGPENDLSGFPGGRQDFQGIPFDTVAAGDAENRAVVTFRSRHLHPGIQTEKVSLDLPPGARGQWLYLLHTTCWAGKAGESVGTVEASLKDGQVLSFPVQNGRDVTDWWKPYNLSNGLVAFRKPNRSETVGLYLSRFPLGPRAPELTRVTLTSSRAAIWIVVGATLSSRPLSFTMPHWIAEPGPQWKALPMEDLRVKANSALDFSSLVEPGPAGQFGRVVLSARGDFVFEKRPDKQLRFFGASVDGGVVVRSGGSPSTKSDVETWARQVRSQGYNLVRPHFLDHLLMEGAKADFDFNPEKLDLFQFMVHCLKTNGIYLYFDAMTSWAGYVKGSGWTPAAKSIDLKTRMYFDPVARKNWVEGLTRLMTTVNPYTGTTLAQDPQVAVVLFLNEQEINNLGSVKTPWVAWLTKKYSTREALARAWTDPTGKVLLSPGEGLENAPYFPGEASPRGVDAGVFLFEINRDMALWFESEIRKIGYPGLVTQFDCFKELAYTGARASLPVISMHGYHGHPNGYNQKGTTVAQLSSLADLGGYWRSMAATRFTDRPFLVTEYGHVFWNRYRHEEGFLMGAYSALQGHDALMAHSGVVLLGGARAISPFLCGIDPISRASQVVATLLFQRGDVTPAPHFFQVNLDPKQIFGGAGNPTQANRGLSGEQTRLALVTGFGVAMPGASPLSPVGHRVPDGVLDLTGTAKVENTSYASRTVEAGTGPFSAQVFLDSLKQKGLLPKANRTDCEKGFFESETGELTMDRSKLELRVRCPRFVGACLLSNTAADLGPLRVEGVSVDCAVALASLDGEPVGKSRHLLLVLITDALNQGMEFDSAERVRLEKIGTATKLVETAVARLVIQSDQASRFRLHALAIDGTQKDLIPMRVDGNRLDLRLDTATLPSGPTPFFELSVP